MGGSKGIIDIQVGVGGQLLCIAGVILGLLLVEAHVLQHQHLQKLKLLSAIDPTASSATRYGLCQCLRASRMPGGLMVSSMWKRMFLYFRLGGSLSIHCPGEQAIMRLCQGAATLT